MSKKITIKILGKPNLKELFHKCLLSALRPASNKNMRTYHDIEDYWDEYGYGEDDYWDQYYWDEWYPQVKLKGKKKGKKAQRDYDVVFPIDQPYDGEEDAYWKEHGYNDNESTDDDDLPFDDAPRVCFYTDYSDEMSRIDFQTLKEFETFCQDSGYYIYEDAFNKIYEMETLFCCLDPYARAYGNSVLIIGKSYSEMASFALQNEEYSDRL